VDLLPILTDARTLATELVEASEAKTLTLGKGCDHITAPSRPWVHALRFGIIFEDAGFPRFFHSFHALQTAFALVFCTCILDVLTLIGINPWNESLRASAAYFGINLLALTQLTCPGFIIFNPSRWAASNTSTIRAQVHIWLQVHAVAALSASASLLIAVVAMRTTIFLAGLT